MHAQELVEVSAIVARHGATIAREPGPLLERGIEQYWTASKCRLDRWGRALKQSTAELAAVERRRRQAASAAVRGVAEEVLTGEILTRVWAAVACAHDRRRGQGEIEPVARSVLLGHLESRHRVLTLLVRSPGIEPDEGLRLDHLRRRSERWTDLLIGQLSGLEDVAEFAIDPERARDFARDLRDQGRQPGGRLAWSLVLSALRSSFRNPLSRVSPNADLNARIAEGILACLPPAVFDGLGVPQSLHLWRLMQAGDDAQGMLEELLSLSESPQAGFLRTSHLPPRFGP